MRPEFSGGTQAGHLVHGEPACPGLVSGTVVTDPDEAEERSAAGEDVILVRATTSPDDLHGMIAARAIVTELGGATSHAAVVSRELGRPCVVGCGAGAVALLAGREVTVDGSTGTVWPGRLAGQAVDESANPDLVRIADWVAPLAPVTVYRAAEYRVELTGGVEPACLDDAGDGWREALASVRGACGAILDTDEGVHAAIDAGLEFVVVEHKLPALLAAIEHRPSPEPASEVSVLSEAAPELSVLRLVAIKGRAKPDAISASLGVELSTMEEQCEALVAGGLCLATPAGLRITPAGRERLTTLLDQERAGVDHAAATEAYQEFCVFNAELKEVITAWQMKDSATPNDHADQRYDAEVLTRLEDLHHRVSPLIKRFGALAPRLARYTDRLEFAQAKINEGEHGWVARPIMDSYHTVWFELHEDLIALCGLTRADEAASGRAQ